MEIVKELLAGCYLLKPKKFIDNRGVFVKTYHESDLNRLGINFIMSEEFYSISYKNVIRGMHFQLPPHDHDKLVYCSQGAVLDVLLDLRAGSEYGKVVSVELTEENSYIVFIPKGIAHGFVALSKQALMHYKTSTIHAPSSDFGIRWDSFGFEWNIDRPIISLRDQGHLMLNDFITPFKA